MNSLPIEVLVLVVANLNFSDAKRLGSLNKTLKRVYIDKLRGLVPRWKTQSKIMNKWGPTVSNENNYLAFVFLISRSIEGRERLKNYRLVPQHIPYHFDVNDYLENINSQMSIPWFWMSLDRSDLTNKYIIARHGDLIDCCFIVGTDITSVKMCFIDEISIGKSLLCKPTDTVLFQFERVFPTLLQMHQEVYIKVVAKKIHKIQVRYATLDTPERRVIAQLRTPVLYSNGILYLDPDFSQFKIQP